MGTLFERLVGWSLRSAATALLIGGVALLVAAVPAWPLTAETEAPRAIVVILAQMGALLVWAGAAANYLLRRRAPVLPNERITVADDQRPALGGELVVLALMLIGVPIWLVVRLQPFLAEWRFVWGYISDPQLWDNANANMSGVVLIPLAGVLTPPFLQLLTLVGFVMVSATLLPLLVARSPRFPRLYVASLVLLSALLLVSALATSGAMLANDALRQEMERIGSTNVDAAEEASVRNALDRYASAIRTTAPKLALAWLSYAIWIPLLFGSTRVRLTLANRVERSPAHADGSFDVAIITQPPRFPGI